MKSIRQRILFAIVLGQVSTAGLFSPPPLPAQPYWPGPYPSIDQNNAFLSVLSQADKVRKAGRSGPIYFNQGGYDMVWREFQSLRNKYAAFKGILSSRQHYEGANDLAELDAGLDIIQEAFANYQHETQDGGFNTSVSFRNMCNVLSRAIPVWTKQLKSDWGRLQNVPY